jgi:hypothetical protein
MMAAKSRYRDADGNYSVAQKTPVGSMKRPRIDQYETNKIPE